MTSVAAGTLAARRARGAVACTFGVTGVLYGSWAARVPAIRHRLDLSDSELGLVLACIALGSVVAMPLAGAITHRVGSRRMMRVGITVACGANAIIALAPTLWTLALVAVAWGAAHGGTDVAMNAHGIAVERRYGRPILSGLHAAFSIGGLLGAGIGALSVAAGIDVRVHLAATSLLSFAVVSIWTRRLLPSDVDRTAGGGGRIPFVRPPRRLWALGALAFTAMLVEGSAADWSAVYLRDNLRATESAAALAFTGFAIAMTVGRLAGDRVVARFGPRLVVRASGVVGGAGFSIALLLAEPTAGLLGYFCLGAGVAVVVPIVYRASAHIPGLAPSVAMAGVFTTGYFGLIAGPAIVGGIAGLIGLRAALAIIAVLAAGMALLSGAVGDTVIASGAPEK
jgi:MFS family permease